MSRGSSAPKTAIIGKLNYDLITDGLKTAGRLRQEFRHLEILDEITQLRYLGRLPVSVQGERRQSLIESWYSWRGKSYVPSKIDFELQWSGDEILDGFENIPASDNIGSSMQKSKSKNHKSAHKPTIIAVVRPNQGLLWDGQNYSCAYDTLFTSLYVI